jgi:hypothetical protein
MDNRDETASLISAGKVQGTNVYNTNGDSLGEVYDVMIDKLSGKVAYAIMSFGGFLGVGERYHPLPWNTLKYDTRQGGYVVGLTRQQLEGAPTFARTETTTARHLTGADDIGPGHYLRSRWLRIFEGPNQAPITGASA